MCSSGGPRTGLRGTGVLDWGDIPNVQVKWRNAICDASQKRSVFFFTNSRYFETTWIRRSPEVSVRQMILGGLVDSFEETDRNKWQHVESWMCQFGKDQVLCRAKTTNSMYTHVVHKRFLYIPLDNCNGPLHTPLHSYIWYCTVGLKQENREGEINIWLTSDSCYDWLGLFYMPNVYFAAFSWKIQF